MREKGWRRWDFSSSRVGDEMIQRLAPDPAPARSQHMGSTGKRLSSKAPLQLVEGGGS